MSIDAKHIIRIIKACRLSGVSELKLGELEIKFGPGDAAQTSVVAGETRPTITEDKWRELEATAEDRNVFDHADEELAHMQVEDPALFEELLVNRELEPSGQEETVHD